jgi:hypothetical protein
MPLSAPCTCRKTWESEGLPVLHACVDLPSPEGHRRIRTFYDLQRKAYLRYCRRFLLPEAKADPVVLPGPQ